MITPEAKAIRLKRAVIHNSIRKNLIEGKVGRARAIALKAGISIFDARLPAEYQSESEPFFAALDDAAKPVEVKEEVEVAAPPKVEVEVAAPPKVVLSNGWPVSGEAEIWGTCINPDLVVVSLADGRKVSLRKTHGLTYRIGDRVRVKLIKSTGDPMYAETGP